MSVSVDSIQGVPKVYGQMDFEIQFKKLKNHENI